MRQLALISILLTACATSPEVTPSDPFVVVLGIAQDGGYPQIGCEREDCVRAWSDPEKERLVASLAIVDPVSRQRWIIDATPDLPRQLHDLQSVAPAERATELSGILLTHAHIGHYLGLAQLGREALGARGVPVYAMPRMRAFLQNNGPWSQLVTLGNIEIRDLADGVEIRLNERISVRPLLVPHRDEFSETVALIVRGPSRAILWLPDIDKWEKWSTSVESVVASVDAAYVDATFYSASELPGRDLSEIPHPLVEETMQRFISADAATRAKIRFVHLNQSNPLLRDPALVKDVEAKGFQVAKQGERFGM